MFKVYTLFYRILAVVGTRNSEIELVSSQGMTKSSYEER